MFKFLIWAWLTFFKVLNVSLILKLYQGSNTACRYGGGPIYIVFVNTSVMVVGVGGVINMQKF